MYFEEPDAPGTKGIDLLLRSEKKWIDIFLRQIANQHDLPKALKDRTLQNKAWGLVHDIGQIETDPLAFATRLWPILSACNSARWSFEPFKIFLPQFDRSYERLKDHVESDPEWERTAPRKPK